MKQICLLLIGTAISLSLAAQENRNQTLVNAARHGWEYEIKAGLNIGGTSPLPLPEEIRSIREFTPPLSVTLEGNVTKWLGKSHRWGIISGVRLENKGMRTKAGVKNYHTEIIGENGNKLRGYWTGGVRTRVQNSTLSVPLLAAYRLSQRVTLKGGAYAGYVMSRDFSGYVYDGYLRKDTPTGDRVNFEGDAIGVYDFSDYLRRFQWGLQVGADWRAFKHLKVFGDLSWGLNDIFRRDFTTISFAMYPIYLTAGFGYSF